MAKNLIFVTIGILLGVNNIFVNFKIAGISYDRILEFIIFLIFIRTYLRYLREDVFFSRLNIFIGVLSVLQLIVNVRLAIVDNLDIEYVLRDLVKGFTFVVFSFLFLLLIKKNFRFVNIIIGVHILVCLFGLMLHPMSPFAFEFYQIKLSLFSNVELEEGNRILNEGEYISHGMGERVRVSGPFPSSIPFSYLLISAFFMNIFMYFSTKRKAYILTTLLIFFVSILTQTRSLILAEVFVFGGIFVFLIKNISRYKKVAFTISAIILLFLYFDNAETFVGESSSRLANASVTEDSRPLLWITGLYTVLNFPFGASEADIIKLREEASVLYQNESVKYNPVHNGFINVGLNYSILGYFVIILFFIFLKNSTVNFTQDLSSLLKLFFVSYLIHTSFHNNFIFYSDYEILMIVGLVNYKNVELSSKSLIDSRIH